MESKFTKLILDLHKKQWVRKLMFSSQLYLVGGIVRDIFINMPSKDIDMVVEGMSLENVKDILLEFGSVDIVGESFKVIKFVPKGHIGEPFDIATPRKDIKIGKGHKGFKTISVKTIREDLKRRDFTINSMAVNVLNLKLIDPFNGKKDLEKGIIKATDKSTFIEDPLRILRALQFSARFEFDIHPLTQKLILDNSNLISEVSGERILEEFEKILSKSGNTSLVFEMLEKFNIDKALFGSKISEYNELPQLDRLSFFFTLGKLGGKNPKNFFMERLKGDAETGKALDTLDQVLIASSKTTISEEDLRFLLFKSIKKSPQINESILIPFKIDNILFKMKQGILPLSSNDILLNGLDVIQKLGKEGPEVGEVLEKVQRAALMKKFDFKKRKDCLEFLEIL